MSRGRVVVGATTSKSKLLACTGFHVADARRALQQAPDTGSLSPPPPRPYPPSTIKATPRPPAPPPGPPTVEPGVFRAVTAHQSAALNDIAMGKRSHGCKAPILLCRLFAEPSFQDHVLEHIPHRTSDIPGETQGGASVELEPFCSNDHSSGSATYRCQ
jgi:hypothetical protein